MFVTLAQLPSLYKKEFGTFPNFTELGFPKLKNFLISMEDRVQLEEFHKNHIKVRLRKKPLWNLYQVEKGVVDKFLRQALEKKRFGIELSRLKKMCLEHFGQQGKKISNE